MANRLIRSISSPSGTVSAKLMIILVFACLLLLTLGRGLVPTSFSSAATNVFSSATAAAATAVEVGQDCKKCHEQVVAAYAASIHGKSGNFMGGERAASCDSCHGNPEKHVRSGKKADIANPAKMTPKEASSSCMVCHSQDKHTLAFQGSEHDRKEMSCLSCHSQHHSKSEEKMLTRFTVEDTCLSCHTTVRKAVFQRSSHL